MTRLQREFQNRFHRRRIHRLFRADDAKILADGFRVGRMLLDARGECRDAAENSCRNCRRRHAQRRRRRHRADDRAAAQRRFISRPVARRFRVLIVRADHEGKIRRVRRRLRDLRRRDPDGGGISWQFGGVVIEPFEFSRLVGGKEVGFSHKFGSVADLF